MIASFFSWFWGTLFFVVAFGALMNPPPYIAIALLFSFMGLVLLPPTKRLAQQKFNWQINGGARTIAIIVSSILIYLIVPQIEIAPSPFVDGKQLRVFKDSD